MVSPSPSLSFSFYLTISDPIILLLHACVPSLFPSTVPSFLPGAPLVLRGAVRRPGAAGRHWQDRRTAVVSTGRQLNCREVGLTRDAGGLGEDTLRFVYRWRVLEFSGGLQEVFGSRCYFLGNFFLQDAETLLRSRSLTCCTCSDSWIEPMVQLR